MFLLGGLLGRAGAAKVHVGEATYAHRETREQVIDVHAFLPIVLPKKGNERDFGHRRTQQTWHVRVSMECVAEGGTINTTTAPATGATAPQAFHSSAVEDFVLAWVTEHIVGLHDLIMMIL